LDPREARHAEDLALARRAAHGERKAFDLFYERSFPPAFAFASRRCADPREAEALTERVLEAAVDCLGGYRGEVALAVWVYAIAREAERTPSGGGARGVPAELAGRGADAPAEDRVEVRERAPARLAGHLDHAHPSLAQERLGALEAELGQVLAEGLPELELEEP
jgi:hypothetical protein